MAEARARKTSTTPRAIQAGPIRCALTLAEWAMQDSGYQDGWLRPRVRPEPRCDDRRRHPRRHGARRQAPARDPEPHRDHRRQAYARRSPKEGAESSLRCEVRSFTATSYSFPASNWKGPRYAVMTARATHRQRLKSRRLRCRGTPPALTGLHSLARQSHGGRGQTCLGDLDLVRPFEAREAGMIAANLARAACDYPGERIRP